MTPANVLALTKLTETQRKVMDLVCHGKTNRQIAQTLGIGLSTVSDATYQIKRKLGIKDDGHRKIVYWYWQHGPGFSQIQMKVLEDALRQMTEVSSEIMAYHKKLVAQGKIASK